MFVSWAWTNNSQPASDELRPGADNNVTIRTMSRLHGVDDTLLRGLPKVSGGVGQHNERMLNGNTFFIAGLI